MKTPEAPEGTQPQEIIMVNGQHRIAKVGVRTLPNGECETFIGLYLPRTREDRALVNTFERIIEKERRYAANLV